MSNSKIEAVSDQDVVKKKPRRVKKKSPDIEVNVNDINEVIPRITLLEAVKLVIEIKGQDYFDTVLNSFLRKDFKYKNYWDRFLFTFDTTTNNVTAAQLRAVFCLLIYVNDKSLPIYGSIENAPVSIPSLYLFSIATWRNDFSEAKADFKTYQKITVEVKDVMYLF